MGKLTDLLIGLIVFAAIIAAIGFAIGDLNTNYGQNIDNPFNETYNKIDELNQLTVSLQGNLSGESVQTQGFFETVTTGAFKVTRLIFGLPNIMITVVQDVATSTQESLGLPPFVTVTIMTIVIALVTLLIISAVLRSGEAI